MYCPNCGAQLADGSQFCPYCNSALSPRQPQQSQQVQQPQQYSQNGYGAAYPVQSVSADPKNDPRGMKWFKFIIYFQLFASALVHLINAFRLFTGAHYEGQAGWFMRFSPL